MCVCINLPVWCCRVILHTSSCISLWCPAYLAHSLTPWSLWESHHQCRHAVNKQTNNVWNLLFHYHSHQHIDLLSRPEVVFILPLEVSAFNNPKWAANDPVHDCQRGENWWESHGNKPSSYPHWVSNGFSKISRHAFCTFNWMERERKKISFQFQLKGFYTPTCCS